MQALAIHEHTVKIEKPKTYIWHGEFLVQSNLYFIHHSNTKGEYSHEHCHLNKVR